MSLINRMLQDLDARRSEVSGTNAYGGQVRAVPPRRGMHVAWWLVLLLGALLAALVAWMLLRPAPVAVVVRPPLPLKLDPGLDTQPPPSQPDSGAPAPAEKPPAQAARPADAPAAPPPVQEQAPVAPAPPPEKKPEADKPAAPAAAPAVKAREPQPARAEEPAPPASANKQVREMTPQQRAENEYRKAALLLQQGKAAEAISGLEQALQIDPQHTAARQALIGALLDSRRIDDALRLAREGMAIDPAQPGLAMILARLQLEKGDLRGAIDTLQATQAHAEGRADYHAFLAALLQRDARHKEAAQHYLLALQKSPQNGVWWMGLGISLQADNRAAEAREAFGRARASGVLSPDLLAFVESKLKELQR